MSEAIRRIPHQHTIRHRARPYRVVLVSGRSWYLRGDLYATLLRTGIQCLPEALLHSEPELRHRGNTCLLVAAWADYDASSLGPYHEFMVLGVTRIRPPVQVTVLKIWVDSAASLAGARALWNIPKQLGDFTPGEGPGHRRTLRADGRLVVSCDFRRKRRLPTATPLPLHVAQPWPGGVQRTLYLLSGRSGVHGQRAVRVSGQLLSLWADSSSPCPV
ncbi:acetoacetate decarboxylase family protein [Streptomyces sp. NPDC002779]|uniref:acetoacetate decarboxylase family protein n=1 Tax=Streptomyces sp. NPDC002779 TaxID=3364664 RepID=UPI0036A6FE46